MRTPSARRTRICRALPWIVAALLPACGGGPGGSDPPASGKSSAPSGLVLSGGSGEGSGGPGGRLTVRAVEGIAMGDGTIPDPPAAGALIVDLSGDVTSAGDVTISGKVVTSGPGAQRSISARNITVSGSLIGGAASGSVQSLSLAASDTIYVSGTIDSSGQGDQTAGNIRLAAGATVVLTPGGQLLAAGAPGGAGGRLSIEAPSSVILAGRVDAHGGAGASGGAGGSLEIGVSHAAQRVTLSWSALLAPGGDGGTTGGTGGTLDVSSYRGGISLSGSWTVSGGDSGFQGGAGGTILAQADIGGGDLTAEATLESRGGSALTGAANALGGAGGLVHLLALFDPIASPGGDGGFVFLRPSTSMNLDGGDSAGSGDAGPGGTVLIELPEGKVSVAGRYSARGGAAPGSGRGGLGGFFYVASDMNHNATGGDIVIESGTLVDVSGGDSAGGRGGDAQWSPPTGEFNPFVIPLAILLDSDSVSGGPNQGGWIQNFGTMVARGGSPGGHGGDAEFHGYGLDTRYEGPGEPDPDPGDLHLEGAGGGGNGTFTSD